MSKPTLPLGYSGWPWVVVAVHRRAQSYAVARFPTSDLAEGYVRRVEAVQLSLWERFVYWAIGFVRYEVRRE